MLKIKDNVDLKELEKYGFKEYNNEYSRLYKSDIATWVNKKTREIIDVDLDAFLTIVYLGESTRVSDLIKADLVEKVEE